MRTRDSETAAATSPADSPAVHPGDMPAADFRKAMHQVADLVADYLEGVGRFPVVPRIKPGDVRAQLPASPPTTGEPIDTILHDFERVIPPGTTHWNHPGFMAYFPVTGSGPGILAESLAAALNVNAMLWRTGPAQTELEEVATDWVRQMIGLPQGFKGHINDTASISSLIALAAARERAIDLDIRRQGLAARPEVPRLTVYCSDQAHSSIDKAVVTLGLGLANLRRIPSDDAFRLRIDKLEEALAADKAAGCRPIAMVATLGTTSTTSVDPIAGMSEIALRENIWLHVDGAYALSACICPEFRPHAAGIEQADSIVTNPHKWLFVPVDCSLLFVREPQLLKRAFSIIPDYLTTTESDVTNLMDYGVQLGRRFRSLKLWMVMRSFGVSGLQERIRFHCRLAREFAGWLEREPGFELAAPVPFATVCFRATPACPPEVQDNFNERLVTEINAAGKFFLSHTRLRGRYVVRMSVGNLRTSPQHMLELRDVVRAALERTRSAFGF